jgi:hypothetical protein
MPSTNNLSQKALPLRDNPLSSWRGLGYITWTACQSTPFVPPRSGTFFVPCPTLCDGQFHWRRPSYHFHQQDEEKRLVPPETIRLRGPDRRGDPSIRGKLAHRTIWLRAHRRPQISTIVQQLCDKAPDIARIFVEEALKRIDVDIDEDADASPRYRKRKRILDPSYGSLRASNVEKPSKVRAAESPAEEPAGESTTINGDSSFGREISFNQISVMAEVTIPRQEANGGGESNNTKTLSKIGAAAPDGNILHHRLSTAKDACNKRNESRPEEMQLDEPKVRQATHERDRGACVLSDPRPSTPSPPDHLEMQPSPQTEEVPRPDLSLVLESSAPESPSPHPYVGRSSFYDMLAEIITVIEMMSKKTVEASPGAHSAILRALLTDTIWAKTGAVEASESTWSATDMRSWSASMWNHLLEAGQSRSKTTIILSLIEEMGAAVWYEAQLRQIAGSGHVTKRGKPSS